MSDAAEDDPVTRLGGRADVHDFLVSRRDRITRARAGLPASGRSRGGDSRPNLRLVP